MHKDMSIIIKRLKEYRPALQQLLMACPYSKGSNIDGILTKEIFMDRLFYCDESLSSLSIELARRLTSRFETNRSVLVTGYNGIGKTTFLWHFISKNPHFESHYINFHGISGNHQSEEPIATILRDKIIGMDPGTQIRCLRLIKNNTERLIRVFSRDFLKYIRNVKDSRIAKEYMHDHIEKLDTQDIIILYLLMLFLMPILMPTPRNMVIIFFDNLDAAGIDYLSSVFLSTFFSALEKAEDLSQMNSFFSTPVLFTQKYRFVFCMRDASSAIINAHSEAIQGPTINWLPYKINLSPEFYREILKKRLDLISEIYGEESEFSEISSIILEFIGDKEFVEPALVDLFNADYRKLAIALFEMAKRTEGKSALDPDSEYYEYGTRGALMHGVVQFLQKNGYLRNHVETEFDPDGDKRGSFHQERMVLNVILNKSRGNIREYTEDPASLISDCTLYDLAKTLKDVYSYAEICETVANCFLYHEKNWVQLLSIYNKPVRSKDSFQEEVNLLVELDKMLEKDRFTLDEETKTKIRKYIEKLRQIQLKITPAGISYLRYLNTHFEYYSYLALPDSPPLFWVDLLVRTPENGNEFVERYEFENIIDAVYDRFEKHYRMMKKFYQRVFKGKLGFESVNFRGSDFCFKYFGVHPRALGMFHSSRVAFSHIDYIDRYRLHAIRDFELSTEELQILNKKLVARINRYVQLLRKSYDDSTQVYCDAFGKKIADIKKSNYIDKTTRIELRH